MHIPKVGERPTLGGLEFEVKNVGIDGFIAARKGSVIGANFNIDDADAFSWPELQVKFSKEQIEAVEKNIEKVSGLNFYNDAITDVLSFMRSNQE